MSISVGSEKVVSAWEAPPSEPLNEVVWQAWLAKGRAEASLSSETRMAALKWSSIAVLVAAAGFWSRLPPYEILFRFLVVIGAMAVMLQSLGSRRYAFAVMFGALALLYNPIAPVFAISGDWTRVAIALSTVPFAASLAWRSRSLAHNV